MLFLSFILIHGAFLSDCKSEDSVKQNLYKYVGESTSTFASEKGPPLADVERLKGNMRRELRNEKYPFTCTDFASLNLRIYIRDPGNDQSTAEYKSSSLGEHAARLRDEENKLMKVKMECKCPSQILLRA